MSRYFLILIFCLVLTLPLEFAFRAKVYRRPFLALKAISIPSLIYLIWDIIATHFDHWAFVQQHSSSFNVFGLPIEEYLFFLFIPICCLLTFESVKNLHPRSISSIAKPTLWVLFIFSYLTSGLAIFSFRLNSYDLEVPHRIFPYYFVATLCALTLLILAFFRSEKLKSLVTSQAYFYTIFICMFFMVFVNGALTILDDPVVTYKANLGPRLFFDIPIEDFIYGTVLLTWILLRWIKYTRNEIEAK
jgi:lycopene cyclase domain-containing protein